MKTAWFSTRDIAVLFYFHAPIQLLQGNTARRNGTHSSQINRSSVNILNCLHSDGRSLHVCSSSNTM